jgi:hypothetical protein
MTNSGYIVPGVKKHNFESIHITAPHTRSPSGVGLLNLESSINLSKLRESTNSNLFKGQGGNSGPVNMHGISLSTLKQQSLDVAA